MGGLLYLSPHENLHSAIIHHLSAGKKVYKVYESSRIQSTRFFLDLKMTKNPLFIVLITFSVLLLNFIKLRKNYENQSKKSRKQWILY